jgi:DNA-binding transcriptional ArsR family regulator
LDLIDALGSVSRLRILCVLAHRGPCSKYRIGREIGAGRRTVSKQLATLMEMGLVKRLSYEAVRLYDLDVDSPLVAELEPLLDWLWSKGRNELTSRNSSPHRRKFG